MIAKFKLQGIHSGSIRSDKEMELIDSNIANQAFKQQKKILDVFLKTMVLLSIRQMDT